MAKRMRRPGMWVTSLAFSVGALTLSHVAVLHGRAADAQRKSGIYLESSDAGGKDEKRLQAQMPNMQPEGIKAAMFSMGFKKPKVITKIAGDKSSVRVAPQATFLFVFGGNTRANANSDPSEMMAHMGDQLSELPQNTTSPKDFSLVVLSVVDGERIYNSGEKKVVKMSVENVESKVFRIKSATPLEPGEYGFAHLENDQAGQIWDFGVDGASAK